MRPAGGASRAAPGRTLARLALLAACGALAACGRAPEARDRPAVRFECDDGCGSHKTVFEGELPPPCCGVPMIVPRAPG